MGLGPVNSFRPGDRHRFGIAHDIIVTVLLHLVPGRCYRAGIRVCFLPVHKCRFRKQPAPVYGFALGRVGAAGRYGNGYLAVVHAVLQADGFAVPDRLRVSASFGQVNFILFHRIGPISLLRFGLG